MREGRLEEIEELTEDAWFVSEVRQPIAELVAEIRKLNGRLEAVCDVVSDAAGFDVGIDSRKVMEAVRGE